MSTPPHPSLSASTITKPDLDNLLLRYDALIDKLDAQKGKTGPGKVKTTESLKTLDRIRYVDIPQRLAAKKADGDGDDVFLEKDEVETLMRWKLYVINAPFYITCTTRTHPDTFST